MFKCFLKGTANFQRSLSRTLSTGIRSNWLQHVKVALDTMAVGFPLNATRAQITTLCYPHQFFDELISSIHRAKKVYCVHLFGDLDFQLFSFVFHQSISLSALYLGTGEVSNFHNYTMIHFIHLNIESSTFSMNVSWSLPSIMPSTFILR